MRRLLWVEALVVVMALGMGSAIADIDIELDSATSQGANRVAFVFSVENLNAGSLSAFYVDIEDGLTAAAANMTIDAPDGWTATFCFPHDNAGWAVACFEADGVPDEIAAGATLGGFEITTNVSLTNYNAGGDNKPIMARQIHVTWTDDTPAGLSVDCSAGDFGPHQSDGGNWQPATNGVEWGRTTSVPSVSQTGVMLLVLLMMAASAFFVLKGLRRTSARA